MTLAVEWKTKLVSGKQSCRVENKAVEWKTKLLSGKHKITQDHDKTLANKIITLVHVHCLLC